MPMNPYHERLARLGLEAAARYGFALAGGYAIQANGFLERPSEDVDLFTVRDYAAQFDAAVRAIIEAYEADGLIVDNDLQTDTYARLYAADPADLSTGPRTKVDLVVDFRDRQPIQMAIGPVTHPDDLMRGKMAALFTRAEPRDLIDVDAALCSGRYAREQLLQQAEDWDRGFDRRIFAGAIGQAEVIDDGRFADLGVAGRDLVELRARFADWRKDLLS